ncbi:uncharacterized protein LOC113172715 isoform X2 [Anabas testudineus]|uniref:uncharacterized protein LOC113172715 isoform X2 n=1 Tax=Anabas testudineus TaxID=64144 RepID=UPI000E45AF1F|nr:uncharacterized protein LOC113172715 isoform X2 [Anabas testudineus]
MFCLNQAALLSVQLLLIVHVHAGTVPVDHRNTLVSRGDSVMLTCNISINNGTQTNWNKDRFYLLYSFTYNLNSSNFTSDRFRIDVNLTTTLNIFNVQHEDAGLYTCTVTDIDGVKTIRWNLTVSESFKGIGQLWYVLYILTPITGIILCGFILAVYICRKLGTRTQNQNQFQHQSGGRVDRSQKQGDMDHRSNRRSQYMERFNSIYDFN